MHIERENPSVLAKVTQVNDLAHGPLVFILGFPLAFLFVVFVFILVLFLNIF
jgi:hypothetical protein